MGRPTAGRAAGATNWGLIGWPSRARTGSHECVGVGGCAEDRARRRRRAARSGFRGFVGEKKAGNGVGVSQPLRLLVDSRVHAEELARFEALVVRGPGADDCAIWKGAIGGDGYGRYWVRRGCGERIMVRANRYALAAAQDGAAAGAGGARTARL